MEHKERFDSGREYAQVNGTAQGWVSSEAISIGLLASAVAIAPLPTKAQDGSAEDLGDVMINQLSDLFTNKKKLN